MRIPVVVNLEWTGNDCTWFGLSSSSCVGWNHLVYSMSALSPEYRTLQKNASKIVDVVAHQCDVTLFSRKLVENDLISGQSANNIVQTMGHSDYNKVSQLMQAVESQIRTASNTTATFETFMQILREIPLDQLADQLADFYSKYIVHYILL